jgi:LysM repeat protein
VTDEISNIARYFKVDVDGIYALNDWTSPHVIQPGDRMRIPPPTG